MAQVNLGRIGFVNKGSWNIATNYKLNDVVKYGGSTYAAKRPNVGITPPTNGTDTDDWFYFVNNSDYVDKTSNQDITGIKNFTNGITTSKINGNPIVPTPTTEYQVANKKYIDDKTIINNFIDKPTPVNTDNLVLQEVGGLFKKLSWTNLKSNLATYLSTGTGFAISLTTNGYIKFPNWLGGLVVQWGEKTGIGANAEYSVIFPMEFPNSCLAVSITPKLPSANNHGGMTIKSGSKTKTGFNAFNTDTEGGYSAEYIAIGW